MNGAELIAAERQRQIDVEGYTAEHDAEHPGEIGWAAKCYLDEGIGAGLPAGMVPLIWPWHFSAWKPSADPICNLVKAAALIAAEIDRLAASLPTGEQT